MHLEVAVRYFEIVNEVVVKTAALRAEVERLEREEAELAAIRPFMASTNPLASGYLSSSVHQKSVAA